MENKEKSLNTEDLCDLDLRKFENTEFKVPYLYETWNWEGDETILPYKWIDLIKSTSLSIKYELEYLKLFIKENFYKNKAFDKKSFFFITTRSYVAGCVYLMTDSHKENKFKLEFLLVNQSHINKGIEKALINLAYTRALEISKDKPINMSVNITTSNIDKNLLSEVVLKFK